MKDIVKRVIVIVLALLMVFSLLLATAHSVFAEGVMEAVEIIEDAPKVTEDGFEYEIVENAVTITKYSGDASEITLPSSIENLPVTKVGERAFEEINSLSEVTIPDSVITIGANAFEGCGSLVVVNLGSGVQSVGADTFSDCVNLTAVFVSENNKSLSNESGVLFSSDQTELIFYPIGNSRESYVIPSTVNTIGAGAFAGCTKLKSVTLPSGLKAIGQRAFLGCEGLEELVLPNGLNSIGSYAFASLKNLKSIEIPSSITQIPEAAFSECSSLVSVKLPSTLKKVDANAFAFCIKLEELAFSEGLEEIGTDAFLKCAALKSITFPKSLKSIPQNALSSCSALATINYAGTESEWQNLKCDFGDAMVVFNYIYGQGSNENTPPPQQNDGDVNNSKPQKPEQNTSSNTEQNEDDKNNTSSTDKPNANTQNRPDTQNNSSNSFVASGETVTFFENDKLSVSGDKLALSQSVKVSVEQISEGLDFVRVKAAVKDYVTKFEVFNLSLTDGDTKVSPADALTIKFKIPEDYDVKKLQLLFVSDRGGASELDCSVSKKSGTISAQILSGGTYVLAEMTHVTRGMSVGFVTLCIAIIAAAAVAVVYFVKKAKAKSKE